MAGWVGFDLDGTLATYNVWQGPEHIGAPVPEMVDQLRTHLAVGDEVRIYTARVSHDNTLPRVADADMARLAVQNWCLKHIGRELPVTCMKDYGMWFCYDDRAVQVVPNTGRLLRDVLRGLVDALTGGETAPYRDEYDAAVKALGEIA